MGLLYFGPDNDCSAIDLNRIIVSIHNEVDTLSALQFKGDSTQMCVLCRIMTPLNNGPISYPLLRCIRYKYNKSKDIELGTIHTFKGVEVGKIWWSVVKFFTIKNIIPPPYDIIDDIVRTAFDIAAAEYYDIKVIHSCLSKDQMIRDYCVNLANIYGKTVVMDSNAISCKDIQTAILHNSGIRFDIPLMPLPNYDRSIVYDAIFGDEQFYKFIVNEVIYKINAAYDGTFDDI